MAADADPKYDVAFSFLGRDEALAVQLNDLLKDRVQTFIYSDATRQVTLAGSDGVESFSRVFRAEARTVVVLYRAGWGDHGFTSVEKTAIQNRGTESGYDFTVFIPLDKPPTVPLWLPRSRIWIGLERWGLEHAATVIESRVQEAGGTPKELTVADVAARAIADMRQAAERDAFLDSLEGVQAAQREFDGLFGDVERVCAESAGFITRPQRENKGTLISMAAAGCNRRITFVFKLNVSNSLRGAALHLFEFDGQDKRTEFHFDFGPSGELGWRRGYSARDRDVLRHVTSRG